MPNAPTNSGISETHRRGVVADTTEMMGFILGGNRLQLGNLVLADD